MTINGWLQIALYFVALTALVVPLGQRARSGYLAGSRIIPGAAHREGA